MSNQNICSKSLQRHPLPDRREHRAAHLLQTGEVQNSAATLCHGVFQCGQIILVRRERLYKTETGRLRLALIGDEGVAQLEVAKGNQILEAQSPFI